MRFRLILLLSALCYCLANGAEQSHETLQNMSTVELISLLDTASVQTRRDIEGILLDNIPDATGILRDKLKTGSVNEKLFACSFIGMVQDVDSLESLSAAIDDPNPKVQTRAVLTIGKIHGVSALSKIRRKLTRTGSTTVLKASLVSIGRIGSGKDIGILERFLTHEDESVRCNAAGAMAFLGDHQGQSILLECTYSGNPATQKEAIYCLGFIDTQESRERLEQILDDPTGNWQSYARIAIAQQEIDNTSEAGKPGLLKALTADSVNRRLSAWAVDQLAELNNQQSREILQEIAASKKHVSRRAKLALKTRRRK